VAYGASLAYLCLVWLFYRKSFHRTHRRLAHRRLGSERLGSERLGSEHYRCCGLPAKLVVFKQMNVIRVVTTSRCHQSHPICSSYRLTNQSKSWTLARTSK
jgi:hypothetical protein